MYSFLVFSWIQDPGIKFYLHAFLNNIFLTEIDNLYSFLVFFRILVSNSICRTISQTMSQSRRILAYLIPVTAISLALNIPKVKNIGGKHVN